MKVFRTLASCLTLAFVAGLSQTPRAQSQGAQTASAPVRDVSANKSFGTHFETSDRCFACHNGTTTPTGEDISMGTSWRTSMMANSARDPYWMASVRRETMDHPSAVAHIQDECSICHMPMMRYESKLAGGLGDALAHLPPDPGNLSDRLADDGVSCTVCHQIAEQGLGSRETFVGGFTIDEKAVPGERPIYGQFEIAKGQTTIMHSSSSFRPTQAKHIRSSELCATCHTLITKTLDAQGKAVGEFPEQVPYQEWLHSDYKETRSCPSCHMPVVKDDVPISSVFGEPRAGFARHTFVGGNFFMQRMLNRFRNELSVPAQPQEMEAAIGRTIAHLQLDTAKVTVQSVEVRDGQLEAIVSVENLAGHKLPTAYPSRRAWLHMMVRDRNERVVFESGALNATGSIQGNDGDEDGSRFEPHYTEISQPHQVQIYESVMAGADGAVTTGLLTAARYVKDNRLLPHGFDKATADNDVAVHGGAEADADFRGGGDQIRYAVAVGNAQGPFRVEAALWYQPVAYRWAMNLKKYDAAEPKRFVEYYEGMAAGSGVMLARSAAVN